MILVTVGTHDQGFNRLVQAMDDVAASLNERVVIQRGSSSYEPQHAEHFKFTTRKKIEQLTQQARIIVAHAAAGSALVTLLNKKPLIVVPRLQRFGEHVDDHQLQLANALDAEQKALAVYDPSLQGLQAAIERVTEQSAEHRGPTQLVHALRSHLTEWSIPTHRGFGLLRLFPFAR